LPLGGKFSYFEVYLPEDIVSQDTFYTIDILGLSYYDFDACTFYISESAGIIGTLSGDIIPSGDSFTIEDSTNIITDSINQAKQSIIDGLLNGIKSLFVPTESDMSEWLTRTQAEISKKLGILGEPINFFSTLMNKLLVGNSEDFIFHIPELIIPGTDYKILDAFDINFTELINDHEAFKTIYDGYIVIISGIMVYCFYSYLWSFYDHILGTRDVESAYKIVEQETERHQLIQKERNRQPIGFKTKGDNRK